MTRHIFIDTNIYLNFFHYSKDDLEELNKLIVLMDNDKVELYLPRQVLDEFYRNRDTKIADALNRFNQSKLDNQFPQFCKEYEEYNSLKKIIKEYNKEKQALQKRVMIEIEASSLKADTLTANLFRKATFFETTQELFEKAKLRFDLGNPPGKNKSYGDALNWETLLENVEDSQDLYFIADDKDYNSQIDKSKFNTFLNIQWQNKKSSQIKYYNSLTDFFKEIFPDIKLATELEKDILISKLIDIGSFHNARKILSKLAKYDSFTSEQANEYVSACLNNSQIYWISDDEDINEYLYNFVNINKDKIDDALLSEFYQKIKNIRIPPPPSV